MERYLLVALGGALGAMSRYLVAGWVQGLAGSFFPWGTLAVNALGSFLLGGVLGLAERGAVSPEARLLVGVGFLGAFTTFSTFSYEAFSLLREGAYPAALTYLFGSLLLGIVGVVLGFGLARLTGGGSL